MSFSKIFKVMGVITLEMQFLMLLPWTREKYVLNILNLDFHSLTRVVMWVGWNQH